MARFVSSLFLRAIGWTVDGYVPPGNYVMIAAPHTSNWDLPIMLAIAGVLGVRVSWMGKEEIFRWPFARFMRWLGGIPVRRDGAHNMVEQMVGVFSGAHDLVLAVPPEGSRGRREHWRSGFYHIARGAGVPVLPGYLDYAARVGGVGAPIELTGDVGRDMDRFREFYGPKQGKRRHLQSPIRLQSESSR